MTYTILVYHLLLTYHSGKNVDSARSFPMLPNMVKNYPIQIIKLHVYRYHHSHQHGLTTVWKKIDVQSGTARRNSNYSTIPYCICPVQVSDSYEPVQVVRRLLWSLINVHVSVRNKTKTYNKTKNFKKPSQDLWMQIKLIEKNLFLWLVSFKRLPTCSISSE